MKKKNQSHERLCADCEDAIPKQRLLARPTATLCVRCQQLSELQGRFKRHQMDYVVTHSKGEVVESMETVLIAGTRC